TIVIPSNIHARTSQSYTPCAPLLLSAWLRNPALQHRYDADIQYCMFDQGRILASSHIYMLLVVRDRHFRMDFEHSGVLLLQQGLGI
ncbi:hypothetical protein PMAYCL1PPCAC_20496, partial [Pristionchus mayeri]